MIREREIPYKHCSIQETVHTLSKKKKTVQYAKIVVLFLIPLKLSLDNFHLFIFVLPYIKCSLGSPFMLVHNNSRQIIYNDVGMTTFHS
jgi:predicted tellurium resistance membrane protein TerC